MERTITTVVTGVIVGWGMILLVVVGGCQTVDQRHQQILGTVDTLSFPLVPMSQTVFVPPQQDFVAVLPQGWFFVDLHRRGGSHILAVATNPEYTLQLVLSLLKTSEDPENAYRQQGIVGVARLDFAQRYRKSGGTVRVVGKFEKRQVGRKEFGIYRFTNDQGATVHRVAVFRTAKGNFYSCSLIQSLFAHHLLPSPTVCDRIFQSVLIALDVAG